MTKYVDTLFKYFRRAPEIVSLGLLASLYVFNKRFG